MTYDELKAMWTIDSIITEDKLKEAAINSPKIEARYRDLYAKEHLETRKLELQLKRLIRDKREFYVDGVNEQTPKEWGIPYKGGVLKNEVDIYLEADKDIQALILRIDYQNEKLEYFKHIFYHFKNRQWLIGNALTHMKFVRGE